jgi:hypothetical protein
MTHSSSSSDINVGDLIGWRYLAGWVAGKNTSQADDCFAIVFAKDACNVPWHDRCCLVMWNDGTLGHFDFNGIHLIKVIT